MDFKTRLKKARFDKGFTQADLSEYLGVSKATISEYESKRVNKMPSVPVFIKTAEYLNLSADYLLGLTKNPLPLHSNIIQLSTQTTMKQFNMIKRFADVITESNLPEAEYEQSFSHRLKQLRQASNMSIRALSDILMITSAAISAYENKRHMPSLDLLAAIAKFFNVSVDYLLCLTDNPFPIHNETKIPYILELSSAISEGQKRYIQRIANDAVRSKFSE